jgi:purine-nucleoside/S-methyl-5'-thioadenosine phosphorylase / adenosine deaminase
MLKLSADNLRGTTRTVHAFFGRSGGVSTGLYASLNCGPGSNDDRTRVIENRRIALAALGSSNSRLLTLYQVHGAETVEVCEAWDMGRGPKADAMATSIPGLALGILTADCGPVLLADSEAGIVGAAHAGWKGALAGIIESAVDAMEKLGARRERITAAIGPCISQGAYEVGDELRASVFANDPADSQHFIPSDRDGHWRFDLSAYAKTRLQRAAVRSISIIPACTYEREADFFSFRRATHRGETDYGRQLSAIMLAPDESVYRGAIAC